MRKKYPDCEKTDGLCGVCSLSSYGKDCHGNNISPLLYQRSLSTMTLTALSEKSGVNIRQLQKYESGEYSSGNMTLRTAVALSKVLDCRPEDLLGES